MPDFGTDEYSSYVELCRNLGLERRFRPEDMIARKRSGGVDIGAAGSALAAREADHDLVWLPQLGDWFDLLETAGDLFEGVCFSRRDLGHGLWRADIGREYRAEGATREEAAARLWMVVRR